MQSTELKTKNLLTALPYILLFLVSFVYFGWFAGYIFYYQEKSTFFLVSFGYLEEHLTQPGKLLEYLGKVFTAFYYYEILGAFLLSITILLIVKVTVLIGYKISGNRTGFIPFFIGAGFIYLHAHYQFLPVVTLGVLLNLVFFYATIRLNSIKRQWLPVAFFPAWYFITGGFAWLFFIMYSLYLITGKRKNRWFLLSLLFLLAFVSFFISQEYLFYASIENLVQFPYSHLNAGMQIWEFSLLAGVIILLPLLFKIDVLKLIRQSGRFNWWQPASIGVILVLAGAITFRTDKKNSDYFYVEKLFYEGKYNELIAYNESTPSTNKLTLFLNNIALAKTGQLTGRMFEFPQSPDAGTLFLKWETLGEVLRRGGNYYYTLGLINEAHRWAYEYMVMRGYTPEGLKMLIKTELINGNYKVAEKYIHILEQSLFYRKEAKAFRKLLYNDVAVDAHPELGLAKHYRPENDFFVLSDEPAINIDYILASDSTNVFAIEYKFALLLLNKDIEGVVRNLPLLEKAGYARLPKHIDEAVSGYKLLRMGNLPELKYLDTGKETEHHFNQYYQVFQQNSSRREQAQRALHQNFAGTFWYYLFFS